jgi:hypothetical protein
MKPINEILQELNVPALAGGAPQRFLKELSLHIENMEKRITDLEKKSPDYDHAPELLDDPPN